MVSVEIFSSSFFYAFLFFLSLAALFHWIQTAKPLHLVDFSCYRPADYLRVSHANFVEHLEISGNFSEECVEFQKRILEKSGVGEQSCMPLALHEVPGNTSFESSLKEVDEVMVTTIEDLLAKTNTGPRDIDFVISNCSVFCPTPSIASMIVHRFGLKSSVRSFNLSGMGCSAGLLSISLANELLRVNKDSTALVFSMEAVTPNGYNGEEKSMLLTNTIFRMGGAAILLSNKSPQMGRAKYKLKHLVRTHMAWDDEAYRCVYQMTDQKGFQGVSLSKSLVKVASKALRIHLAEVGPLALPYSDQFSYLFNVWVKRKREIVPNFKKAFEHFCIHAGGRAIIDALDKQFGLSKEDVEPSRMTLHRFGNTSSSSIWYELMYLEAKGRMRKGDKVWQIAFGSGFKCNSAVWEAINSLKTEGDNAWSDIIQDYPVQILANNEKVF